MKKLNWIQFNDELKRRNFKIFSPKEITNLFNISPRSVQAFLNYYQKKGKILKIRNNFYCLSDFLPSDFEIANYLYQPSYLSLETALSFYGMIPEVVYDIISITTKKTTFFSFNGKNFHYHKIKRDLYFGYDLISINNQKVYLATYEKAILDYGYFCFLKKKIWNERFFIDKKRLNFNKLKEYLVRFNSDDFDQFIINQLKKY